MKRSHAPATRTAGQALVEFALVFPIFMGLIFGLIDMGRAVYSYNTLAQAAREGARLAAVEAFWVGKTGTDCAAPVCPANTAALRQHIVSAVNRMTVGIGTIASSKITFTCSPPPGSAGSPSVDCGLNRNVGASVTVTVSYTYLMITPFVAQIVNNIGMSGSAAMVIN